jgi:hypothetical protein
MQMIQIKVSSILNFFSSFSFLKYDNVRNNLVCGVEEEKGRKEEGKFN